MKADGSGTASHRVGRREFLGAAAGLVLAGGSVGAGRAGARPGPLRQSDQPRAIPARRVAVLTTVYRIRSHSYHIAGRFLHGYRREGQLHRPNAQVVSMYVDQVPAEDLSRELAEKFGFRIFPTVADALTLGTGKLAVDAVLLIAEHGDYPDNEKGQKLYPRFEFYSQIVEVFRQSGRAVPVFNDKHLSYSWPKAKKMVELAHELGFPLMAGSSLPVTWRRPELELPLEVKLREALVAAFSGIEVYGFHALETFQVMAERRSGGETGMAAVTCLEGDDVWRAGEAGRWSLKLLDAALGRSETRNIGEVQTNVKQPVAFLLEYRDGFRGTVLLLNDHVSDFTFAAHVEGEAHPASTLFLLPAPPGANFFDCQVANIEKFFDTGKPPYPVERTLLTSGVLDFAMESRHRGHIRLETPELAVQYQPPADSGFCRGPVAQG